jgi:phosphotransferase system enzyme I (PtsP)
VDALGLAAIGLRILSMRPASIGPVKALLRQVDLVTARAIIDEGRARGVATLRPMLEAYLRSERITF